MDKMVGNERIKETITNIKSDLKILNEIINLLKSAKATPGRLSITESIGDKIFLICFENSKGNKKLQIPYCFAKIYGHMFLDLIKYAHNDLYTSLLLTKYKGLQDSLIYSLERLNKIYHSASSKVPDNNELLLTTGS